MVSQVIRDIAREVLAELMPDDAKLAAHRARIRRREERRLVAEQLWGYASHLIDLADRAMPDEIDELLNRAEACMRRAQAIADGVD